MATSKQLIVIENVVVEHLLEGQETLLGSGALGLSLVSLAAPPAYTTTDGSPQNADLSKPSNAAHQTHDEWLVMSLTGPNDHEPIIEVPISSTFQIVTLPPSSYVVPNYAVPEDEEGGFIKVTLPSSIETTDRERFESILWGWPSFSDTSAEASSTSISSASTTAFAAPSQFSVHEDLRNTVVLIDETSGQVLGSLEQGVKLSEDPSMSQEGQGHLHDEEPVILSISEGDEGEPNSVNVKPLSAWEPLANENRSKIISLADYVSRGIVVGAETLGKNMEMGAEKFVKTTKAAETPLVFKQSTKTAFNTTHKVSQSAVKVSGKTIEVIGVAASKIGDTVGKTLGIQSTPSGKPPKGVKGVVNRSLIAFNAITDSLEIGGKTLLEAGSKSSSAIVGHKYGQEAQELSATMGASVKHVALVYIDARGVTRKALLKTVGKSAIRAKMADGSEVILSNNSVETEGVKVPDATPEKSGTSVPAASTYGAGD